MFEQNKTQYNHFFSSFLLQSTVLECIIHADASEYSSDNVASGATTLEYIPTSGAPTFFDKIEGI